MIYNNLCAMQFSYNLLDDNCCFDLLGFLIFIWRYGLIFPLVGFVPVLRFARCKQNVNDCGHKEDDECDPEDDAPLSDMSLFCFNLVRINVYSVSA